MIKVYTASKLRHVELWLLSWENVEWTARWPSYHVIGIPDSEGFAARFWEHDLSDVQRQWLERLRLELEIRAMGKTSKRR